jgi:uncharacterized protein YjdB
MKKILYNLFRFRGVTSGIFYIALIALLWYLIIPHTLFYYNKTVVSPLWHRLNKRDVTLVAGETFKLRVMELNKRVSFRSTDIKVADVDLFGNVTAYRCGTTIIRARVDGKVLKCRVRVIRISKERLKLKAGKSSYLKIKGAVFGVSWESSDSSVVIINRYGKVTAVSVGNAMIIGKVDGKEVSCKVTVK